MDADAEPPSPARMVALLGARIALIGVRSFLLLLAIRWCARTYPGLYFPDSAFLNDQLNGVGLFTGFGYNAVLLAAAAAVGRIVVAGTGTGTGHRGAAAGLRALEWASLAAVTLIFCWGVYCAERIGRLPLQEDGTYRFIETLDLR
jgi:hypothetical protein